MGTPLNANPIVKAGFKCAPLIDPTAYAATATAKPHPIVITIQPESFANDFFKLTPAQTPPPSTINNAVPINSPKNADIVSLHNQFKRFQM